MQLKPPTTERGSRRYFFWAWIVLFLLGEAYLRTTETFYPAGTECSPLRRVAGTQCIFAFQKSRLDGSGFLSADGSSIIFADENDLRIEPIGLVTSLISGTRLKHPYRVWNVALSKDRQTAVTCIANEDDLNIAELWIWNLAEGTLIRKLDAAQYNCPAGTNEPMSVTADGNTLILNLSRDEQIGFIRLDSGTLQQTLAGDAFALSPDEGYLAVQDTAGIKILEYPSLHLIRNLESPQNTTLSLSFSNDGKTLIGDEFFGSIYVWDLETGKLVSVLHQLETAFCAPVASQNNVNFFTCSDSWLDGTGYQSYVFQWMLRFPDGSGNHIGLEQLVKLSGGAFRPLSIDISPDGNRLLITGENHFLVFNIEK
jgi:WD40 repeat protein